MRLTAENRIYKKDIQYTVNGPNRTVMILTNWGTVKPALNNVEAALDALDEIPLPVVEVVGRIERTKVNNDDCITENEMYQNIMTKNTDAIRCHGGGFLYLHPPTVNQNPLIIEESSKIQSERMVTKPNTAVKGCQNAIEREKTNVKTLLSKNNKYNSKG